MHSDFLTAVDALGGRGQGWIGGGWVGGCGVGGTAAGVVLAALCLCLGLRQWDKRNPCSGRPAPANFPPPRCVHEIHSSLNCGCHVGLVVPARWARRLFTALFHAGLVVSERRWPLDGDPQGHPGPHVQPIWAHRDQVGKDDGQLYRWGSSQGRN